MDTSNRGVTVEVFVSDCPLCADALDLVDEVAAVDDRIVARNLSNDEALERAEELGITSVPAVALDGRLAACCRSGEGIDASVLREAGLGDGDE